jgi:lipoic acid synthetase
MILGDKCTRKCRFCNVKQYAPFPEGLSVDLDEPYRIAQAVKNFNLEYVVITSVTRDDLEDGGAGHFAKTIKAIKKDNPYSQIEVLIPDFRGSFQALEIIQRQSPEVISHNLETVKRIFPCVRHKASYKRSLNLLKNIKLINQRQVTKSSIMLGLGETDCDLRQALYDLRSSHCDILVLGQYLSPTPSHYPVHKFYTPHEFKYWRDFAYNIGFLEVCSFPLARTSYLPSKLIEA